MIDAVRLISRWLTTTTASISRLEHEPAVPAGPRSERKRQLACMLCLCYGVDPGEFNLSPDDLPPGWKIPPRRRTRSGDMPSTNWYKYLAAA